MTKEEFQSLFKNDLLKKGDRIRNIKKENPLIINGIKIYVQEIIYPDNDFDAVNYIYNINDNQQYFKVPIYYNSWDEKDHYVGEPPVLEVKPTKKTIVVWE